MSTTRTPLSHMTDAELVAYVLAENIKDPLVLELVARLENITNPIDYSVKS